MAKINTLNYQTVAAWNGSQDLFIVEQPDGTKVATPAMVKQYVLGNSIDDIYSVMGQNGAKNLIPYPYFETTKTHNGVTFTDNGDGSITVDTAGEASTGAASFNCQTVNVLSTLIKLDKNKKYIFSDSTHSGIANNNVVAIRYFPEGVVPSTSTGTAVSCNSSNNWQAEISNAVSAVVYIYVYSGKTINNITFKPMLRLASDTDDTYQPYAKTNKQLTEEIGDLSQTGLTGDSVAAQLGTAREQIANLIKYTDIIINASTSGHGTPTRSSAGAYYEPLATYAALGVTRDKILSINLIDWNGITKSFTPYLGSSTVSVMTDSDTSIYAASGASNIVMRVVYKD